MAALTGLVMQTQLVTRRAAGHGDPQRHDDPQFLHSQHSASSPELKRLLEVGHGL